MSDNKIRVSIVEDTDDIREAMRVLINGSQGFECIHVFPDGETALLGLPSNDIDVVLMDINLPGMNGIECMRQVKDKMPQAQFMMCTVYDDDECIFSALESGATGYLLKRTSPAQILEAIRDLHEGGSPMSSEIARRVVAAMQKKNKPSANAEILSDREKEILDFLAKGFLYKEIAETMQVTYATVHTRIRHIYEKLHVHSRTEAVAKHLGQTRSRREAVGSS